MNMEFRHGPLGVYEFDKSDEIELEIEGIDYCSSVSINRTTATQLRDWLTEQIEGERK